ncbi:response regulator transcription factor [Hyphobacterium sp. CCMP332]|nr:response regulator transcription factor [Hyphobacterium sp. CCMP332]
MKVLIIEDEELAAKKLSKMLREIDDSIEIMELLSSVKEASSWFDKNDSPDLIFTDIQLGDGLSFDIFENQELKCPVIFTTAFDQYAIKAFEVNSIDYLLKPVQKEKIRASLEKYEAKKRAWNQEESTLDVKSLLEAISEAKNNYKSRFLVKLGNKIHAVKTEEIAYFYSDNKLTFLVNKEGNKYPMDISLDEILQQLNPELFFRINRKYIIHLDAASEIKPYFKGRLKISLKPGIDDEIVISADKTPAFKAWLDH